MKATFILFISLWFITMLQAQVLKTVEATPGKLSSLLTEEEKATITDLTLTGSLNATDFGTMKRQMPLLTSLDLSAVSIVSYKETNPSCRFDVTYPENTLPGITPYCPNYTLPPLTSLILPNTLTAIGWYALGGSAFSSIVIPPSVTTIGEEAIKGCEALTTITVPSSVIELGWGVFSDCSNLTSIDLPPTISTIKDNTFLNCISLNSIIIPSSVTSIGGNAFYGCSSLSEISLPPSLTYIGYEAFYGCSALTSVVIPSSVTDIDGFAFANCTNLRTVSISPIVEEIYPSVFNNCTSLSAIYLYRLTPPGIGLDDPMHGVDRSTCTLYVPYGSANLYASAPVWKDFTHIVEMPEFRLSPSSITLEPEQGTATVELTANVGWTVRSDQPWLIVSPASGSGNASVTLTAAANPSVDKRIAMITFSASGSTSPDIIVSQHGTPVTIQLTAGNLSFEFTSAELRRLNQLIITGTMDARDFKTLRDEMPLLEVLDISGVTIEAYTDTTFGNQILHPANAIPAAIYEWNDSPQTSYALSEHNNLAVVKLPVSMTSIGYRAFHGCTGLTEVDLQSTVTYIGNEAFQACYSLASITLAPSVTYLGEKAFYFCSNLASIELSPALKAINGNTFAECKALTSIDIPASVTSIEENAFTGCSELQSVKISPQVTVIRWETFKDCSSLTSVTIPPLVTNIEGFSFFDCTNLKTLIIPPLVNQIGHSAFNGCRNLESIYSYSIQPVDIGNTDAVFADVDKTLCILYVPVGSKELYAVADQWKDFKNIIEMTKLEVSKTEVTLEAAPGSSISITISGNAEWTVSWEEPWLEVDPATGTGEQSIILTALEANMADTVRMAIVTISALGFESQPIVVTQLTIPVEVDEMAQNRPAFNCYPNPFTQEVNIEIQNPKQEKMTVNIYNLAGQRIKNLVNGNTSQQLNLKWDGTNEKEQKVPPGIYLCKMNRRYKQLIFGGVIGSK